jgi:hypothetical protein
MNTSPVTSLRADTPEAGLLLARQLAERELALAAAPSDMAAHLRGSPSPHVTELAARLFSTVAAANNHWLR